MTLKIRKLQRDSQSVLLLVHDRSGASHNILEALSLLLKDIAEDNPRCSTYLSEVSPQVCSRCNNTGELITDKYGNEHPGNSGVEPAGGGSIHECPCIAGEE